MACYIASNDNRVYAALETQYGTAAAATASSRVPAVKLGIKQTVDQPKRKDKTGSRTFPGLPNGMRKHASFELISYMTGWDPTTPTPAYSPLFQAALGAAPLTFNGATVSAAPTPTQITTAAPHGLTVNQAVAFGGEIRFVAAIVDPLNFFINAPFSSIPATGATFDKTVTFVPSETLASTTLFDYWDPSNAVQRVLPGSIVDKLRLQINGDFHQFSFSGAATQLIDSVSFASGQAGLTTFPAEPSGATDAFSLVAGNLGQAWFGAAPAQFHTVLSAEVTLDNKLDLRDREFGQAIPACIVPGEREVTFTMKLISNTNPETTALYQAGAERSPISVMFQLGQVQQQLCGVYLPGVIPELPEFDDQDVRLQWNLSSSRAQGSVNDEIAVAFA